MIFASLILGGVASAAGESPATQSPSRKDGPEPNPGRAAEMHQIENQFYVYWKQSLSSAPDYKAIRQALDRMGESVGKVKSSSPGAALEKPLEDLSSKIDRLKKAAGGKDLSAIRKGYDDLYQSCFQCHFTHEQPR